MYRQSWTPALRRPALSRRSRTPHRGGRTSCANRRPSRAPRLGRPPRSARRGRAGEQPSKARSASPNTYGCAACSLSTPSTCPRRAIGACTADPKPIRTASSASTRGSLRASVSRIEALVRARRRPRCCHRAAPDPLMGGEAAAHGAVLQGIAVDQLYHAALGRRHRLHGSCHHSMHDRGQVALRGRDARLRVAQSFTASVGFGFDAPQRIARGQRAAQFELTHHLLGQQSQVILLCVRQPAGAGDLVDDAQATEHQVAGRAQRCAGIEADQRLPEPGDCPPCGDPASDPG